MATVTSASLPLFLAGPIVRRAEASCIHIWLCTSRRIEVEIDVYPVVTAGDRTGHVERSRILGRGRSGRVVRAGPALSPQTRPQMLLLLGDQIYADDVSALLIESVERLAELVCGAETVPDLPRLDHPLGMRRAAVWKAGFTTGTADYHLLTFGEFA